MKKWSKRIISLALASIMTLSLAACGGNNSGGTSDSTKDTTKTTSGENDAGNSSGEITTLVMSFPTWTGAPVDTQAVQDAMNEITRDKIGIEIELQITDYASYNQSMTLALSGGETIDILSCLNFPFATAIQQDYLMDLEKDDLLNQYGSGIIEAMGMDMIDACRSGGVLYGLPNKRDMAQGKGCVAIATQYLEGIGYDPSSDEEIIKISLNELKDIYAQLHEAYPDKEVFHPETSSMSTFTNIDMLGGNVFGVLLDEGQNLDVVNLFTSDTYREYCELMYFYNQSGYISKDAATDTTAKGELVKAGTLMSYAISGKPGIKAQASSVCGQSMTIFQTGNDYVSSNAVASFPWCIPITSSNPEAAMTYLNELYTNADLQNILAWGIEGEHYVIGSDGLATYPEGVDASNSGWNHSMGWLMPNQFLTHVWEGNDPELWTKIEEFNSNAQVSMASGFTFDSTNVANEMTAVQNVYNEYQASVEYGFVDPATGISVMNEKMVTAGLEKIIAEKARQLEAWNASK